MSNYLGRLQLNTKNTQAAAIKASTGALLTGPRVEINFKYF